MSGFAPNPSDDYGVLKVVVLLALLALWYWVAQ